MGASDPFLAFWTAALALRVSVFAVTSDLLNPYFRRLSLRKEIKIVLFLPFLRTFSCDIFFSLLRYTLTIWGSLAPQT